MCFFNTFTKVFWSTLAKNFLMSHFKIQQVLVLFLETLRANCSNLLSALHALRLKP